MSVETLDWTLIQHYAFKNGLVLKQGVGNIDPGGHSPANFSFNPEKPWGKKNKLHPEDPDKCFRCVWLGLELITAINSR